MQALASVNFQWLHDYHHRQTQKSDKGRRQQLFECFLDLVRQHYGKEREMGFLRRLHVPHAQIPVVGHLSGERQTCKRVDKGLCGARGQSTAQESPLHRAAGVGHVELQQSVVLRQVLQGGCGLLAAPLHAGVGGRATVERCVRWQAGALRSPAPRGRPGAWPSVPAPRAARCSGA